MSRFHRCEVEVVKDAEVEGKEALLSAAGVHITGPIIKGGDLVVGQDVKGVGEGNAAGAAEGLVHDVVTEAVMRQVFLALDGNLITVRIDPNIAVLFFLLFVSY